MMTSMWAKVSLYIHIFPKENRATVHVFFFFLVPIPESVLLGVGNPPNRPNSSKGGCACITYDKRGVGGWGAPDLWVLLYTALRERGIHHNTPHTPLGPPPSLP